MKKNSKMCDNVLKLAEFHNINVNVMQAIYEDIVYDCVRRIDGCRVQHEALENLNKLDDEFMNGYDKGISVVLNRTKQHFGVEE